MRAVAKCSDFLFTGAADGFRRAADRTDRIAKSPNRTADAFTGLAEAFSRTVSTFIHTAGSSIGVTDASSHTAGRIIRLADVANRMAGCSSHPVFRQKHAKSGKNHPFSPSRRTNRSKSDSCGWGYRQSRQRLGVRQPSAAFARGVVFKAAEDCRTPKPHGHIRSHSPQFKH